MKKTKVDDNLYKEPEIRGVLGAGTYNCAHLVKLDKEDVVMRVGLLEYEEYFDTQNEQEVTVLEPNENTIAVLRGLHVASILQTVKDMLGPSLLKEKIHYVLDPKEFTLANNPAFCAKIKAQRLVFDKKNIPYKYAVQYIEYLDGKTFAQQMDSSELAKSIFCLLWFLRAARKKFEFSHRDLKSDNIVFRTYKTPRQFVFYYENEHCFSFMTKRIPVIIDFDLATVGATLHSKMDAGTRHTAPPEAILTKDIYTPPYIAKHYFAYDYWSVGVCILETVDANLWMLCDDIISAYFDRDDDIEYFLVYSLLMTISVTKNTVIDQLVPSTYFPYFTEEFLAAVAECIMSKEFNEFADKVAKKLHPNIIALLTKLLSWMPEVRTQVHFFDLCFQNFHINPLNRQMFENEEIYNLSVDVEIANEDEVRRDYQYIASKCISCAEVKEDLKACTCCAAMFCGETCHAKMH